MLTAAVFALHIVLESTSHVRSTNTVMPTKVGTQTTIYIQFIDICLNPGLRRDDVAGDSRRPIAKFDAETDRSVRENQSLRHGRTGGHPWQTSA
ncbi:hypothetical protein [Hyphomicrobium sp.]|uniref:hypothetical protein n=1 Tax=Hyphomicrobium sp. TaxID=82 RepID=UPI0035672CC2